ncbi:MAG: hypothetical protein ABL919_03490 [Methylococcales bacterium]|nr:hypothetical protein [Methylococcaceae bacterium]
MKIAVTASDSKHAIITFVAIHLPEGAVIENIFDSELQLPKAVITWTPTIADEDLNETIVLKAVANSSYGKKSGSVTKTISVTVLPPAIPQILPVDVIVKSNAIVNARYVEKKDKLEISGQVIWEKTSTISERKALILAESVVISDASTHAQLGTAKVDVYGNWQLSIAQSQDSLASSIDASFHGKSVTKVVTVK